jgi:hypothetical protein
MICVLVREIWECAHGSQTVEMRTCGWSRIIILKKNVNKELCNNHLALSQCRTSSVKWRCAISLMVAGLVLGVQWQYGSLPGAHQCWFCERMCLVECVCVCVCVCAVDYASGALLADVEEVLTFRVATYIFTNPTILWIALSSSSSSWCLCHLLRWCRQR